MAKIEELINKYMDNQLSEEEKTELEKIIRKDKNIKEKIKEMDHLKEVIDMLKPIDPDREWEKYWDKLYNRIERGIGWIITSIGSILLLSFAGFQLVRDLIKDPELALYAKIGILALIFGLVILFVSVLRERIFLRKYDKYSKEVKR